MKRFLVLGGTAASLVVAGATHPAASPPALLTYSVQPAGGLCLARASGSGRVRLTRGKDRAPAWSPNGRFVAFSRQVGSGSQIFVATARGRVVRHFGAAMSNTDPAWSPEGRRIAYTAGSNVVVATAAGRTLTTLPTSKTATASSPSWSADGRIAYAERVDLDAGGQTALRQIYVVNADGSGRRSLVGQAGEPSWAPRGGKIAYVAYESRLSEIGHVAVANADGSSPHRVSASTEAESGPAWLPSGRQLAFARGSEARSAIVVARADGSSERVAVRSSSYGAVDPAWRRAVPLPRARRAAC